MNVAEFHERNDESIFIQVKASRRKLKRRFGAFDTICFAIYVQLTFQDYSRLYVNEVIQTEI